MKLSTRIKKIVEDEKKIVDYMYGIADRMESNEKFSVSDVCKIGDDVFDMFKDGELVEYVQDVISVHMGYKNFIQMMDRN